MGVCVSIIEKSHCNVMKMTQAMLLLLLYIKIHWRPAVLSL